MAEYETKFDIRHRRPICVTQDALMELAEIMGYARVNLMPPPPILLEEGTESPELEEMKRKHNASLIEGYERELSPMYAVGFSSGFRPSKSSIQNLMQTLNAEPDAPVEIDFSLGSSYSQHFSVRIGDIYGASVSVRVGGPDSAAENIVRRVRNWLKIHEPEYAWLRSTLAYFLISSFVSVIGSLFALYSNFVSLKTILAENQNLAPALGAFVSVFMICIFIVTYTIMKQTLPHTEFQLGWSQRKSKVKKSQIAGLISLLVAPVLLHWVGLT